MTPREFELRVIAILGTSIGWQSNIAKLLEVTDRSVRGWLHKGKIPDWVEKKLDGFKDANIVMSFLRDEWVIGVGAGDREHPRKYITHLYYPQFVARIVAMKSEAEVQDFEHPVDLKAGILCGEDKKIMLCEMEWFDVPKIEVMGQAIEAAKIEVMRHSAQS